MHSRQYKCRRSDGLLEHSDQVHRPLYLGCSTNQCRYAILIFDFVETYCAQKGVSASRGVTRRLVSVMRQDTATRNAYGVIYRLPANWPSGHARTGVHMSG